MINCIHSIVLLYTAYIICCDTLNDERIYIVHIYTDSASVFLNVPEFWQPSFRAQLKSHSFDRSSDASRGTWALDQLLGRWGVTVLKMPGANGDSDVSLGRRRKEDVVFEEKRSSLGRSSVPVIPADSFGTSCVWVPVCGCQEFVQAQKHRDANVIHNGRTTSEVVYSARALVELVSLPSRHSVWSAV